MYRYTINLHNPFSPLLTPSISATIVFPRTKPSQLPCKIYLNIIVYITIYIDVILYFNFKYSSFPTLVCLFIAAQYILVVSISLLLPHQGPPLLTL
jgi:hypothetical protein